MKLLLVTLLLCITTIYGNAQVKLKPEQNVAKSAELIHEDLSIAKSKKPVADSSIKDNRESTLYTINDTLSNNKKMKTMKYPFELPKLPYAKEALAPQMTAETIDYHYGKHLATYIANLNGLVKDTPKEKMELVDIIKNSDGGVYNNAAQTWNHIFFFEQFAPKGTAKTAPKGALADAINSSFGSLEAFKEQFNKAATTLFGSGWAWLVVGEGGKLEIEQGSNAITPIAKGKKVIMTADVWEHAYYIDYRNSRPNYLNAFWEIMDWSVVEARF